MMAAMIVWRTFACAVAVLGVAVTGCGDDGEPGGGFTGTKGNGSSSTDPSSTSGSTAVTSTGTPTSTTTTAEPTSTGPDVGTTTSDTTTTTTTTTTTPSTTDDSTTEPDTTTTTTTTQTSEPAACGNGVIDPNEQCDGVNLNGFTCEALGNAGGSLACDPVTCTFDTSMCMGSSSGGTSG